MPVTPSPSAAPRVRARAAIAAASIALVASIAACATPGPDPAPAAPAPPAATTAVGAGDSPTCGGRGVDPDARIRYRAETVINAPLSKVWETHTDVAAWPSWQRAVLTNERLDDGPLRPGSAFRWTSPVPATPLSPPTTLTITSTVREVDPNRCILWEGPAEGTGLRIDSGVHVWNFSEVPGGTRVVTEETHAGAQIEQDVPLATQFLGSGLEEWLRNLKATAERP